MLFYILIALILICLTVYIVNSKKDNSFEWKDLFSVLFGGIGFSIAALIFVCFVSSPAGIIDKRDHYKFPIKSLDTKTTASGNFFLGSGSFGSKIYFCYYVVNTNGRITLHKTEYNDVELITTDKKSPSLQYDMLHMGVHSLVVPFHVPLPTVRSKVLLTIPENTIIEKYQIN